MPTAPTAITTPPTIPDRADRTTFPTRMYNAFVYLFGSFWSGANALGTNCYNNAGEAATAATNAAASATAASGSAAIADAIIWVTGTTYAVGDARFSPNDLMTYRRKTAGAGSTDPQLDPTNWQLVGLTMPMMHALALTF